MQRNKQATRILADPKISTEEYIYIYIYIYILRRRSSDKSTESGPVVLHSSSDVRAHDVELEDEAFWSLDGWRQPIDYRCDTAGTGSCFRPGCKPLLANCLPRIISDFISHTFVYARAKRILGLQGQLKP